MVVMKWRQVSSQCKQGRIRALGGKWCRVGHRCTASRDEWCTASRALRASWAELGTDVLQAEMQSREALQAELWRRVVQSGVQMHCKAMHIYTASRVEMYCKQSSGSGWCKATPPSSTFHLTALAAGNNMPWSACNLRCDTFWYSLHLGLTILYTMVFILDISMIFYSFWTFHTLIFHSIDIFSIYSHWTSAAMLVIM